MVTSILTPARLYLRSKGVSDARKSSCKRIVLVVGIEILTLHC